MDNQMKKTTLDNTHVPDKVYAYSLQVRHALYELLNCSNDEIVSIEIIEDVATEKEDGSVSVTQLKSILSNKNPISNRAKDLWKTFYNWLLATKVCELNPDNTLFKLFITASRTGDIVHLFSNASTFEVAQEMWEKARQEFYDESGKEINLSEEYALYIRNFFDFDNFELACKIIKNFELVTIDENHTSFLFREFCKKTPIHEDILEHVFIYMLGWIELTTAEMVELGKAMAISYKDYKTQLIAITRELNQNLSLKELAPRPTEGEIQDEYEAIRIYIKQLDIVDCDYTDKIEAISDFLRASTNRTIWANRGDVSATSLMEYQEELISKWKTKKEIIALTWKSLSDIERGKLLFLKCKKDSINLGHLVVPSFFTPGCYHALTDNEVIGWHPNYKQLLQKESENDDQSK